MTACQRDDGHANNDRWRMYLIPKKTFQNFLRRWLKVSRKERQLGFQQPGILTDWSSLSWMQRASDPGSVRSCSASSGFHEAVIPAIPLMLQLHKSRFLKTRANERMWETAGMDGCCNDSQSFVEAGRNDWMNGWRMKKPVLVDSSCSDGVEELLFLAWWSSEQVFPAAKTVIFMPAFWPADHDLMIMINSAIWSICWCHSIDDYLLHIRDQDEKTTIWEWGCLYLGMLLYEEDERRGGWLSWNRTWTRTSLAEQLTDWTDRRLEIFDKGAKLAFGDPPVRTPVRILFPHSPRRGEKPKNLLMDRIQDFEAGTKEFAEPNLCSSRGGIWTRWLSLSPHRCSRSLPSDWHLLRENFLVYFQVLHDHHHTHFALNGYISQTNYFWVHLSPSDEVIINKLSMPNWVSFIQSSRHENQKAGYIFCCSLLIFCCSASAQIRIADDGAGDGG